MNDQQLEDLKQFIDSRISESQTSLESKIDSRISESQTSLESKIEDLRLEMNDGFAGVAEAIEVINERLDDRDKKVERRFIRLEQQAA
jgi:hypothetical protein